jgi:hypothetical protein
MARKPVATGRRTKAADMAARVSPSTCGSRLLRSVRMVAELTGAEPTADAVAILAADVHRRAIAAADILLPATAAAVIRRRVADRLMVAAVDRRTEEADRPTVEVVAADRTAAVVVDTTDAKG